MIFDKGDWYTKGHSNRIFCIKYDKYNKNLIYSGGWDANIFVWDTRVGSSVSSFFGPIITG